MFRKLLILAAVAALLATATAVPLAGPAAAAGAAQGWLIGNPVFDELGFPNVPEVTAATAANGDTLAIDGSWTFDTKARTADGGGSFVHRNSDGDVVGAGEWAVTKYLNFDEWGPGDDLSGGGGPNFENYLAGRARFKVELTVGSVVVATGVLEIVCVLDGAYNPAITSNQPGPTNSGPAWSEGISLNLNGSLNFDGGPPGPTLFTP
jgi:hypothetical protein